MTKWLTSHFIFRFVIVAAFAAPFAIGAPAQAQQKARPKARTVSKPSIPFMVQHRPAKTTSTAKRPGNVLNLYRAARPTKPQLKAPIMLRGLSPEEQARMEAFASCVECFKNATTGPFSFALPRLPTTKSYALFGEEAEKLKKNWATMQMLRPFKDNFFWNNYVLKYTRANFANLTKITAEEVKRTRHGISGNRYKGYCKEAVNDILVRSGVIESRIPGDHARQSAPYLRTLKDANGQNKFIDIAASIGNDASKAPEGAIIVYNGGRSGHIEIKVGTRYCSDYCASEPIDRVFTRKVSGIFLPVVKKVAWAK